MEINKISVECEFVKNLGNYQSVKLRAGAEASLEKDEPYKKAYDNLWKIIGDEISNQLKLFGNDDKTVKKGLK